MIRVIKMQTKLGGSSKHYVVIDDRELIPVMQIAFENLDFDVQVERLSSADYIIDDKIAVSLKCGTDFIDSVHSGHMHNEIMDMLKLPERYFILLLIWDDGELIDNQTEHMHKIAETINGQYIPIYWADGRKESVDVMAKLAEKYEKESFPLQYRRRVELYGSKHIEPVLRIYMNLSHVGEVTANALFQKYPSLLDLIKDINDTRIYYKEKHGTKEKWLKEIVWYHDVPNLGEKTAKSIERILVGDGKTMYS